MNLNISLLRAISLFPEKIALTDGKKAITYEELGRRVGALCEVFNSLDIKSGDVIACLAPNCQEYLELYYACAFSQVVFNPLNYRLSAHEINEILNDSGAKMLIAHDDFKENALDSLIIKEGTPVEHVVWLGSVTRLEPPESFKYEPLLMSKWGAKLPQTHCDTNTLAQLYYTSGTTGSAKGVMLTHGNVASNAMGAICELGLNQSDCWAHLAPMFHLVDAWSVWALTWVGGKHTFLPYFKAETVLPILESESVSITALVPTMLSALLSSSKVWEYSYDELKAIMTAGSPVAPDLVRQVNEVFQCDYIQFYGMTETSPFLTVSTPLVSSKSKEPQVDDRTQRAKTGRPFIGCEVKVVRENGEKVENNNQEVGEIIAKGPNITPGYWKRPEITAQTIRNGWIYTGDLAVIDDTGFINIVDRKKDMIITGGENVYSTEVEHVLYDHASVFECAVIGVPDPKWGETIKAFIVKHPDVQASEEELIQFVRNRLAHYKAPRSIEFMEELPKTGSGKIHKKTLRDACWQGFEKKVQ